MTTDHEGTDMNKKALAARESGMRNRFGAGTVFVALVSAAVIITVPGQVQA